MGTLEDALRKSGLVSKKQAKQARHKKRVHRSEVGRDGLEAERLEKERTYKEQLKTQKEKDQRLEAERAEKEAAERASMAPSGRATTSGGSSGQVGLSGIDRANGSGALSGDAWSPATLETIGDRIYRGALSRTGGPKQYFFVLEGGQTRHVEVNDETFRRLQDGGAGIVRPFSAEGETVNPYHFVIVDRSTALQVRAIIPDCVLELEPERGFGGRR